MLFRFWVFPDCTFLDISTYVGYDTYLPKTQIGRYVSIASNVRVVTGNHPTSKFVSTHGAFYSKDFYASYVNKQKFEEFSYADYEKRFFVTIGNDVWIGSNVLILNGVRIGDGAVVAAGAVVVKNVDPYSIVGGVPAKEIRKRFDNDDISFLEEFCWWNLTEPELMSYVDAFEDIEFLKKRYNEGKR